MKLKKYINQEKKDYYQVKSLILRYLYIKAKNLLWVIFGFYIIFTQVKKTSKHYEKVYCISYNNGCFSHHVSQQNLP